MVIIFFYWHSIINVEVGGKKQFFNKIHSLLYPYNRIIHLIKQEANTKDIV